MPREDQDLIDEMAKVIGGLDSPETYFQTLSGQDQAFYDGLEDSQKSRVERLVALKSSRVKGPITKADISISKEIDPSSQRGALATEAVIKGDIDYYNNLPEAERQQVDRIVGTSVALEQYQDDPDLRKSDEQYYASLEKAEKEAIGRLGRVLAGDPNAYLTNEDQSYYEFMAPEKRERINRLIAVRGMNKSQKGRLEMVEADKRYVRALSDNQAARLFRLTEIRKANDRILGKNLEVDYQALTLSDVIAKINTYSAEDFEFVTVSGKLINLISGLPTAEIEVPLVDDQNEVIKLTTTEKDGSFRYSNLPADQNFRITTGQTKTAGEADSYFIKDLDVKGSKKVAGKIKYENIYFGFNSDTLSRVSVKVLEELVELSHTNKEFQVEMNAYTDRIGSDDYNLALSERRGKAAFSYLVSQGMPRTSLVMNAKGKAAPAGANNRYRRQLNRRVEFEIFGVDNYDPKYVTYIVKPKTTLFSISKAFQMTVDEFVEINGLTSNVVEAYSPVRVKKIDRKPDPDLVFQGSASFQGLQKYVVQPRETVITIAKKLNIPEELLMELNGLTDHELSPGQEINIYSQ